MAPSVTLDFLVVFLYFVCFFLSFFFQNLSRREGWYLSVTQRNSNIWLLYQAFIHKFLDSYILVGLFVCFNETHLYLWFNSFWTSAITWYFFGWNVNKMDLHLCHCYDCLKTSGPASLLFTRIINTTGTSHVQPTVLSDFSEPLVSRHSIVAKHMGSGARLPALEWLPHLTAV